MPPFLRLVAPDAALASLLRHVSALPDAEEVATAHALGRVTARPVVAPSSLPPFSRSAVDGYAVRAADTRGASDALPLHLDVAGEVEMGAPPALPVTPLACFFVHTGGLLPDGADAVVMLEQAKERTGQIEVVRSVTPGENVLRVGEDATAGEVVLTSGVRLRAAEIGGLMALGLTRVMVGRRPSVAVISSGDEVIPPEMTPQAAQIRDVNSYTVAALVAEAGGTAVTYGIVPDTIDELSTAGRRALNECDAVVISAGSSASTHDVTAEVINRLGPPGVLIHGVNMHPGKPTVLAHCMAPRTRGKAVVGLPGDPVSAFVASRLFLVPVVERLLGLRPRPRLRVNARLAVNVASLAGRDDYVPVRLQSSADGQVADPVFGQSSSIFTLVRADALLHVPASAAGLNAGDTAELVVL